MHVCDYCSNNSTLYLCRDFYFSQVAFTDSISVETEHSLQVVRATTEISVDEGGNWSIEKLVLGLLFVAEPGLPQKSLTF